MKKDILLLMLCLFCSIGAMPVHNELNKLSDTIKKKVESGEFPNIKYTRILRDGIPEEEILRDAKERCV